jgi:MFS transporter, PAT family, beta-lactamase induction signal transducer AmpG
MLRRIAPRHVAIAGLVGGQVIPNLFILFALPAIYRKNGIDLADIGILSIALFPFWFKWLWAPIVDRFGNRRIGLRKSWIIPGTLAGAAIYGSLSFIPPSADSIALVAGLLILKNLVMATQDIAVDAYVVEALEEGEEPTGASIAAVATLVGGVIGGQLLVGLYDTLGWSVVAWMAAAMLVLGSLPAMLLPERPPLREPLARRAGVGVVISELKAHLRSPASWAVLGLLLLVQIAIALPFRNQGAFLVDKGLSLAEIGFLGGGATTIGAILGNLLGGKIGNRFGLQKALWIGCGGLAGVAFIYLYIAAAPMTGIRYGILELFAILLFSPFYVALNAARFRWCSPVRTGTDYTLQSSLTYVAQATAGVGGALIAESFGWVAFFVLSGAFMLLCAALTARLYSAMTQATDHRDRDVLEGANSGGSAASLPLAEGLA